MTPITARTTRRSSSTIERTDAGDRMTTRFSPTRPGGSCAARGGTRRSRTNRSGRLPCRCCSSRRLDPLIPAWVPEALGAIAREAGNLKCESREHRRRASRFMENPEAMVDEIVRLVSP